MTSSIDALHTTVPLQQDIRGVFPLVLSAPDHTDAQQTHEWIQANAADLLNAVNRHGVVLFRGFPVKDASDFDRFISAFGLDSFTYADSLSNAVRVNLTPRVFTANEAPPNVSIYLHHEMAQTPVFPSKLFFFCEKAPDEAGQTPVCRSDALYDKLLEAVPEFVEKCERLGVKYSHAMPGNDDLESGQGRSWRSTLGADNRAGAEQKLRALNYTWDWQDDGSLAATTPILPAVRTVKDGRKVFFNQLIAAFCGWANAQKSIQFGDDSAIDPADMQRAVDLAEALTFDLPWQAGDVAAVDNFTVMHGRRPFKGTRRVLASLVANDGTGFIG